MTYPIVTLKPGKDIPIRAGHPWVFSEAIADDIHGEPGLIVEVRASNGASLGLGTWNGRTSIRVRLLTRDADEPVDAAFFASRLKTLAVWKEPRLPTGTDGYRVCHAEADGIPGLIVDRYANTFVMQLHTAGMERLRTEIVQGIRDAFAPTAIVERSDVTARKIEGLADGPTGILFGTLPSPLTFTEAGLTFLADVQHGQKTGFFLDQREARLAVGSLAAGRRVLNLFGYTGAFSLHAAATNASFVTTVDVSHPALETAQKNFSLNGLDPENASRFLFLEADVMDLLHDHRMPGSPYDLIVCDPPAFAKSAAQASSALKAYTDLNAACLRLLEPGGLLVTSSCSGRVSPEDFRSMLRIAAGRANKDVRVLRWIGQPVDHAERLAFPEGRYLKTAVLDVR